MATGIICEYNPFHNGHLYHINKIKEMYPNEEIILVMSSSFLQRGESSIINKWDKAKIALDSGINLVIELPFVFSSQGADVFAKGSIDILNSLNVNRIVFGSELNDIECLKEMANIQINNFKFNNLVKEYMSEGINYPSAVSKSIKILTNLEIKNPNDILGVAYIKEILRSNSSIKPVCIKRTNDFHSKNIDSKIISATACRELLNNNKSIDEFIPSFSTPYYKELYTIDKYYNFLKYKILSSDISKYQTVDEGIESRIKKCIVSSDSLDELINNIKSKRFTYNKIKRLLVHILCDFTKVEAEECKNSEYIRVLGFDDLGKIYLNKVKKSSKLPIITRYSNINSKILEIELRVSNIYYMIAKGSKKELMESEYKRTPIIKK